MRTAFKGRNFCSGTENCEFSVPMPGFSQIPPQGRPDAAFLRNGRAGQKPAKGFAAGSVVGIRNAARCPRNILFLGRQPVRPPASGDGSRSAAGAASGAGATTTRLAWRATVAGLQHERVADSGTQPQPGARCADPLDWQGKPKAKDGGKPQTPSPVPKPMPGGAFQGPRDVSRAAGRQKWRSANGSLEHFINAL